MSGVSLIGIGAAALVGIGLYGVLTHRSVLRRVLAFNLVGAGVFLMFGIAGRRGAAAGLPGDPVPHALVITGIVVAFAATALAVALLTQLADLRTKPAPMTSNDTPPPSEAP